MAFTAPALAGCIDDSLKIVADDGGILIMQSGHVYKVDGADTVDTQLWLSADGVLICGGVMINKDEDGEKASVTCADRCSREAYLLGRLEER